MPLPTSRDDLDTTPSLNWPQPDDTAGGNVDDIFRAQSAFIAQNYEDLQGKADTGHNHSGVYEPADATILKGADIGATVQAHDDATAKTDEVNTWTKAQRITPVAVTSTAGSVTLDLAASNNFTITLTEDTVLADPTITDEMVGQVGAIDAANGATAYALLYSASPVWTPFDAAADLPTVSGDVNVTETFVYKVESLTVIRIMKVS